MDARNLADLYELPMLDWAAVDHRLDEGLSMAPGTGGPDRHSSWLVTLNEDGSPHLTGIGALWLGGSFWFETGERSRKGRNLARDPRCSLSLATAEFDLVVEGEAVLVEDPTTVAEMAARWAADGWPAAPDETGTRITAPFSAPSAGPPPWALYRLTLRRATALATIEPGGATTWTFDG